MKRFHVHVAVDDLEEGIRFYSALFGASPTVSDPITRSGCWTILGSTSPSRIENERQG